MKLKLGKSVSEAGEVVILFFVFVSHHWTQFLIGTKCNFPQFKSVLPVTVVVKWSPCLYLDLQAPPILFSPPVLLRMGSEIEAGWAGQGQPTTNCCIQLFKRNLKSTSSHYPFARTEFQFIHLPKACRQAFSIVELWENDFALYHFFLFLKSNTGKDFHHSFTIYTLFAELQRIIFIRKNIKNPTLHTRTKLSNKRLLTELTSSLSVTS